MLNLEVQTTLATGEVVTQLKTFFGKGGVGLHLSEDTPQCLAFEGGGGYVRASICAEGEKTRVSLVTQEWEYQVKEFAKNLP
jgi:hypothetical protein